MKHSLNLSYTYPIYLRQLTAFVSVLALSLIASVQSQAQVGVPNAWGGNQYGQLGDGTANNAVSALSISKLSSIVQIAGGGGHSLALQSTGLVFVWGHNDSGQLGDGTSIDKSLPIRVPNLKRVAQVAAGGSHSLVLKTDGTVWAWGLNTKGQLGDGTNVSKNAPVQVSGLSRVVQVAAGVFHSIALKADGTVWVWGANDSGQLGIADRRHRNVAVQVATLKGVVQVAGGDYHSMVLKTDGTVWAWGTNNAGQLGDGTNFNFRISPNKVVNLTGVAQISTGAYHSLALKFDGTVWSWGFGTLGQLGNGGNADSNTPVQVSGVETALQVAGGGNHSLALLADGTIEAWGENTVGQLGDGTTSNHNLPAHLSSPIDQTYLSAGATHSFSITAAKQDVKVATTPLTLQYGKPINLTGLLHLSNGLPLLQTPLVFNLDAVDLGMDYTDASGKALFPAPNSPQYKVGTHPITVTFIGNGLFNAASPATATLTITKADTSILCPPITAVYGQKAPLLATLRRKTDGAKLVARTLSYKLDGTKIGQADTDGKGRAIFSYHIPETLALGAHTLIVGFAGDDNHNVSTITSTLTVNKAPTTVLVTSASGGYGKTVALIGLLRRASDKVRLVSQPLTFKIDGVKIGDSTTNSKGIATLNYKLEDALSPGAHTIEAVFAGNSKHNATTGGATLTVNKSDTGLLVPNLSGNYGQTLNLVATLSRLTDRGKLGNQTLNFSIEGVQIGQATTDAQGKATLAYLLEDTLAPGVHTLTVDFAGTDHYNPITGTATLTTNKAATKIVIASASGKIGDTISLTAKLKRTSDGKYLSAKAVHFFVDGMEVGASNTDSNGEAVLSYTIPTTLTLGKHKLAVSFGGDGYYLESKFDTATLSVN